MKHRVPRDPLQILRYRTGHVARYAGVSLLRHQPLCFGRLLAMARGTEFEALPLSELIRVTRGLRA
jgi:hypothetical protein